MSALWDDGDSENRSSRPSYGENTPQFKNLLGLYQNASLSQVQESIEDNEHSLSGSARSHINEDQEEVKMPPKINVQNIDINASDLVDSECSESLMDSNESGNQLVQAEQKPKQVVRCLVANDNTFLLGCFRENLQQHFDTVHTARDGQEVVDKVLAKPPSYYNFLVLDIDMPELTGIEAANEIVEFFEREAQALEQAEEASSCYSNSDRNRTINSESASVHDLNGNAMVLGRLKKLREKLNVPLLFACTANIDPDLQTELRAAGFTDFCQVVDDTFIRKVKQQIGLIAFTKADEPEEKEKKQPRALRAPVSNSNGSFVSLGSEVFNSE